MTKYNFSVDGSVSINKIYSSPHWTVRSKLKKKWRDMFALMLKEYDKPDKVDNYRVRASFNNRLDLDNNVMMVKFFNDALKQEGWIADDNPNYFTTLKMSVDKRLKKNTAKIVLEVL